MNLQGSDTTSVTLANMIFSLLSNPTKLEKAQAEIDEAFENIGEDILTDELIMNAKLPYVEGCINESLRLFPASTKWVGPFI
jgi:cytochrome P450